MDGKLVIILYENIDYSVSRIHTTKWITDIRLVLNYKLKINYMKLKSNNIIATRNTLSKDITHYWLILRRENVIYNSQVRNYDLHVIYNKILQKSEYRIKIKMFIQAINMGYTDFTEFAKDTNYETLFTLSEKNEQLVQLGLLEDNILSIKNPKGSKSKSPKTTEIFTLTKIRAVKKKLTIEINALNKKIEEFNLNTELTVDDSFSYLFAA